MRAGRLEILLVAAALAAGLTGCQPGALDDSPSPSEQADPSATPVDPAPSETLPVPSAAPSSEPVEGETPLACDALVTPQQVYDVNPNFVTTTTPDALPAPFEAVLEAGGGVCAWSHTSTGDVLLVGVAPAVEAPAETDIQQQDGDVFTLASVQNSWWIVVASEYFTADDPAAEDMTATVAANLSAATP